MRKDFVNIDSVERLRRKKIALMRQSLKRAALVAGLTVGIIGGAAAINSGREAAVERQQAAMEQQGLTKIYKSVVVQEGETLTSVVNRVMEEYPDTAKFYTTESIIKEVAKICHLSNVDKIQEGTLVTIPYYIPIEVINEIDEARNAFEQANQEKAAALADYENYVVQSGDSYWKIAYKYTDDENEVVKLVAKIQDLNGSGILQMGSTIKIPNIEKYKLLHAEYEEEASKTM